MAVKLEQEWIPILEQGIRDEYNLDGFEVRETKLTENGIAFKFDDCEGTRVSVACNTERGLNFYYEHLVSVGDISRNKVGFSLFMDMYASGIPVTQMNEESDAMRERQQESK